MLFLLWGKQHVQSLVVATTTPAKEFHFIASHQVMHALGLLSEPCCLVSSAQFTVYPVTKNKSFHLPLKTKRHVLALHLRYLFLVTGCCNASSDIWRIGRKRNDTKLFCPQLFAATWNRLNCRRFTLSSHSTIIFFWNSWGVSRRTSKKSTHDVDATI